MGFRVTHKDKRLIVYLISVAIIAVAYQFGARVFLEKAEDNNAKIEKLTNELNELSTIYSDDVAYYQKIDSNKYRLEYTMERFPGGFTQENTLLMLQDIEDNTGAWISRVDFSDEKKLAGSAEADGINAVSQKLSIDYSCSYDDFKKFLNFVENYSARLFISSLSASYSDITKKVSGEVVITQYAIDGAGKEIEKPDLSGITTGTDNIFTSKNSDENVENVSVEVTVDTDDADNPDTEEANTEKPDSEKAEEENKDSETAAETTETGSGGII